MRCTLLFSTQIAYIFCILSASHIINSIRWIFIKIWTKWKTSLSLMAAGNTNTNTNNVYIKLIPRFQPLSLSLSLPLCLYHSLSHSFVHYNCNTSATTFVRGAHLAIKRAKCSVNFIRSIPNKLDRQNLISHTLCQPNKKKTYTTYMKDEALLSFEIRCHIFILTKEICHVWCVYIKWWHNWRCRHTKRLKLSINCIADGKRCTFIVNSNCSSNL